MEKHIINAGLSPGKDNTVVVKLSNLWAGNQFDDNATEIIFARPEEWSDLDLCIVFTDSAKSYDAINIGAGNSYVLPSAFTQTKKLAMQVSMRRNGEIVANSNVERLALGESLKGASGEPAPPPESVTYVTTRDNKTPMIRENEYGGFEYYSLADQEWKTVEGGSYDDLSERITGLDNELSAHEQKRATATEAGHISLADIPASPSPVFSITLPPVIYVAVGQTIELYFAPFLAGTSQTFEVCVNAPNFGKTRARKWTLSATPDMAGKHNISLHIYDGGKEVYRKDLTVEVIEKDAQSPGTQRVMFIGDSLVNDASPAMAHMSTSGTNDYGGNLFQFVGTQGTAPYNHEGHGGYTTGEYIKDVTNPALTANPFWNRNTNALDFKNYSQQTGIQPTVVHVMVGTNDLEQQLNMQTSAANLRVFVDAMRRDWPDAYIYVSPPPMTGNQDSWYNNRFRVKSKQDAMWLDLSNRIIAEFAGQEDDHIYVTCLPFIFDSEYNYPTSTVAVNPYNSKTVSMQSDPLHPISETYRQIGSIVYSAWTHAHPIATQPTRIVTLTNGVQQADFTSVTAWDYSGLSAVGTMRSIGGGVGELEITTAEAKSLFALLQYLNATPAHKYYLRASFQWEKPAASSGSAWLENDLRLSDAIVPGTPTRVANLQWHTVAGQAIPANATPKAEAVAFVYSKQWEAASMAGMKLRIKEPMFVDLTAAFGAGKEPSNEWLNENLGFFTGSIQMEVPE